jgi:hypothetical protein
LVPLDAETLWKLLDEILEPFCPFKSFRIPAEELQNLAAYARQSPSPSPRREAG